ncbi:MAG TPA: hypothetical protein VFO10_27605 [Oligoflexus sp.]|uniref:hypothetical protein n=1 Tax=Oligoflexus sp. TaxID=1971216 RepID=UPI002D80757D|nr:hypothetical protein [Oligoflexus sp.]HET9241062.1 hypothetical protein [Oligoflexus sp.]
MIKAQAQGITHVDGVQALELIFQNQFSSKDQASLISGRGLVETDPVSGVQTLIFQIELGLKRQTHAA